jgi:hypothetical protein
MSAPTAAAAPGRNLEPTHPCIRCGREGVPADAGLCELCNPLELSQPSATQMHGIAAVGIILFVIMLAVAGRAVIAGTGPFAGTVAGVAAAGEGLAVTIDVTNQGSRAAATTCYVTESPARIGAPRETVQAPLVPPNQTVRFTATVLRFGTAPRDLAVDCATP